MTPILAEPAPWPRRRWLGTLSFIFLVQLGLIFALSDRKPIRILTPRRSPDLQLVATPPAALVALTDPTLFALPHPQGFAGLAWLKVPKLEFHSFDWSEPTNWLALDPSHLGATFNEFSETNLLGSLPVPNLPEADLSQPFFARPSNPRTGSTWRVEGNLAQRRVISSLQLPSRPNTELLTNTVVQVVVDARGRIASVPLLLTSSTDKDADGYALEQARSIRFEPIDSESETGSSMIGLTWGKIIFEWDTVPKPATNSPGGLLPQ